MPASRIQLSSAHLAGDHHDALTRAVTTVLATELAHTTIAQLVDGLPQSSVAFEARGHLLTTDHPLYQHKELCVGALEMTQALRESFDPDTLSFSPDVHYHPLSYRRLSLMGGIVDKSILGGGNGFQTFQGPTYRDGGGLHPSDRSNGLQLGAQASYYRSHKGHHRLAEASWLV